MTDTRSDEAWLAYRWSHCAGAGRRIVDARMSQQSITNLTPSVTSHDNCQRLT